VLLRPVTAASRLGIRPLTLATWSEKFGYPRRIGVLYRERDVEALREALPKAVSVSEAVQIARGRRVASDG